VPRPRRLASRTGLRSSRLIPDSAEASPLRLHSRPPLHSGRPTVTDCSTVRLTSSPAPNQRQRVETASLGSAPAKAGAHPVPPTRRATTTPAPARKARSVPPHAPGGFDARGGTTPLETGVRFVRKAYSQPNDNARHQGGKPSARYRARRPPASLAIRVPLRHGEGVGTAAAPRIRAASCPTSIVRVMSGIPPRPAPPSCALLPLRALLSLCPICPPSERVRHPVRAPGGGIFDIRGSSALGPAASFGRHQSARANQFHCGFAAPQRRF
jgi:hypothetical protein